MKAIEVFELEVIEERGAHSLVGDHEARFWVPTIALSAEAFPGVGQFMSDQYASWCSDWGATEEAPE